MKLALTITTPNITTPVALTLLRGNFADKLAEAVAMGYAGVELLALRPEEVDSAAVAAQVAAQGLEIVAIASGGIAAIDGLTLLAADSELRSRAENRLWSLISCAAQLGAPLVTIGGFRGRIAALGATEGRAMLVNILRRAAEHAGRLGVRLVFEPLNRYETDIAFNTAEALELLDEVDHSNLGLLIDTFHANIEEPSLTECFRLAMQAGRLWHVHLGDSNRLAPGQGHIDFAAIVATLRSINYQGYLSAELLAQPDPFIAAKATADYMLPLLRPGAA